MDYLVAILIFILVYVVTKFLLGKVDSLASLAEVLAVVAGALVAIWYVGGLR